MRRLHHLNESAQEAAASDVTLFMVESGTGIHDMETLVVDRNWKTTGITVVYKAAQQLFVIPETTFQVLLNAAKLVGQIIQPQPTSPELLIRLTAAGIPTAGDLGPLRMFRGRMDAIRTQLTTAQGSPLDLELVKAYDEEQVRQKAERSRKRVIIGVGALTMLVSLGVGAFMMWRRRGIQSRPAPDFGYDDEDYEDDDAVTS